MTRLLYLLLPLGWMAGCAAGPDYHPPKTTVPPAFANGAQPHFNTAKTVDSWWHEFHDAELDRLVERAGASNLDLRIATANLLQARALRLGAKADAFPVVAGEAGYNNEKYSQAALFDETGTSRTQELYDAGFDAAWELDFFGRVRRKVESSSALVEAAEAGRRGVQVSLVSEVARNYFELRGAQNELAVQRSNASNQLQTLNITQSRLEAGGGTKLDVARARAEWNNTLAGIPPLESALARALHRLSVLLGQQPAALTDELQQPAPMPELPAIISIGSPESLLRRRPDIRVAERNLAAATANIGVAVSDLFPRVTFNGNIGLQATTFVGLGGPASDTRSFGPSLTWAALDLGHVRSAIKAAHAQADTQLAQYEKTVLTSLEETENALVDYGRDQARRDYLEESVKASRSAAALAHERFDSGATDFLAVLDAERVALETEAQLAQTQTQTAIALVAVYKSLGGGWEK
jgi:outer membrane protein, multidrug efflux system